jgi:RNA-directed DNA polymerase
MDLKSDRRQNIQIELDFPSVPVGETREAGREEIESPLAAHDTESPANTTRWMEEVCERDNLKEALRQVKANKGSAGIDRMTVGQLSDYLKQHWPFIREQLLNGTYEPKPVRRVEIPKPDGGVRKLGIPTVLDRLIQQAVMQVLQRRWDRTFSDSSYGFRPGRSAHQAVAQAQKYIAEGYGWCVDLDLEKFFDSSQSRQTDGSDCQTSGGQAAAQTHSIVLERGSDGERTGQPERGRHSARRSAFATAQQSRAR